MKFVKEQVMVSAVQPVQPYVNYYAFGVAANSNATTTVNASTTYGQIQALLAEEDLLEIGASSASGSSASGTSIDSSLLSADLLNLSPAALNILNGIEDTQAIADTSATDTNLAATGNITLTATTTLTPEQQTVAADIVAEFATQPVTQQTFTQIESALTAAGINPQEISIQQLLGAYEYAYAPGLATGQLYADSTLASDLLDA